MKLRLSRLVVPVIAIVLFVPACTPQVTPSPVDTAATMAIQLMQEMLTQTALAASPTPLPATATLVPTETPTPLPTESKPLKRTVVKAFTGCYYGPGPEYTLDSNISEGRRVEIVGIGSVPGWYVIVNPYFHKQCWVNANDLEIDPARDLSTLPVMTPMP
jgi:hypothetical protein